MDGALLAPPAGRQLLEESLDDVLEPGAIGCGGGGGGGCGRGSVARFTGEQSCSGNMARKTRA